MNQFGVSGKILRVNLESGKISREEPGEAFYKRYLGGRGVIVETLLREVPGHADPLGPHNKLIFAAGLLTGHRLMGSGRVSVGAKSPLTGGFGESEAGGLWGAELRRAGYDGLIVEGVAAKPVYLWIRDDLAELRDAREIWGARVRESMEWLQGDVGDKRSRTALIGPGGEKRVLFAGIIVDCSHAFGRTGMGAVMGSKNLKGIVVKGSKSPAAKDSEKILALNRIMTGRYKSSPFHKYGTGSAMKTFEAVGNLPIHNHAGGSFASVEKIDAVTLLREHGTGMEGCYNCPIRCKKKIRIHDSKWDIDPCYGGPEYETLASFGSNLLIDDLQAICKANDICNSHGMDTISTGGTIAFAMECYENGILTKNDLDGLDLRFGNAQAMVEMVQKIANREGIGDLLAKGSKKAAEAIGKGSMKFAMQVKGLEIPYHNPRLHQGLGLHYSVHAVGADHVTGVIDGNLLAMMSSWESINVAETIPASELSGRKVRMLYELGLWRQLPNSLGICSFMPWSATEMCEAVEAVTGWKTTTFKLMKAVERGMTLMRVFNLREGFTREDDMLPERFFGFPQDGPLKNTRIETDLFRECREIYYNLMGWDKDGVPTKACLIGLDLEWALPYLASH